MVYEYVVTLQNRIARQVDRFSVLLCGASMLMFLLEYIASAEKRLVHVVGVGLIALLLGANLYRSIAQKKKVHYNYLLFITALVWASMPFYPWLSIPFLIMGLIERQAKKNLEIGFTNDRIVFNSFPRKQYAWKDFDNIVLRDNLLTLDFVDNRLFQRETIDEEGDADEDEFNQYCAEKLKSVAS